MSQRELEEPDELSPEELEEQEANELPNREAMSVIQGPLPPLAVDGPYPLPTEMPERSSL